MEAGNARPECLLNLSKEPLSRRLARSDTSIINLDAEEFEATSDLPLEGLLARDFQFILFEQSNATRELLLGLNIAGRQDNEIIHIPETTTGSRIHLPIKFR